MRHRITTTRQRRTTAPSPGVLSHQLLIDCSLKLDSFTNDYLLKRTIFFGTLVIKLVKNLIPELRVTTLYTRRWRRTEQQIVTEVIRTRILYATVTTRRPTRTLRFKCHVVTSDFRMRLPTLSFQSNPFRQTAK